MQLREDGVKTRQSVRETVSESITRGVLKPDRTGHKQSCL